MVKFSGAERLQYINKMENTALDLLVIGGGITGAGIALDAQVRGLKTGLVEMNDFASGTSSRSTKLVHGGLRYLKQFEIKLVAEVGRERAIVYENAPHVTTPVKMLLPIFQGGTFGSFSTSLGLRVYDFLAKVRRDERRKMLNKQKTVSREPLLRKEGLKGAGLYVEYRTDDARLTLETLKKAVEQGTLAVNYAKVKSFIYKNGKVVGVNVVDQLSGKRREIYAKKIVNAAGPWVDTLREMDKSKKGKYLHLTKGTHIVFNGTKFPLKQAVYFDTPFKDDRMIFAIPRDGKVYVGTTETNYVGDPKEVKMTEEDLHYLVSAVQFMFPNIGMSTSDVESSWAGVRPLIHEEGKDPSEISRKDEIFLSNSGLITIAGGKLTGYRKMAERTVDMVTDQLQKEGDGNYPICSTIKVPLSGGNVGGSASFEAFVQQKTGEGVQLGLTSEQAKKLVRLYGSNIDRVFDLLRTHSSEAKASGLPLDMFASLLYGLECEMVATPSDFLIRRTGALWFDITSVRQWKDSVILFMAGYFQWTQEESQQFTRELEKELVDVVEAAQRMEPLLV